MFSGLSVLVFNEPDVLRWQFAGSFSHCNAQLRKRLQNNLDVTRKETKCIEAPRMATCLRRTSSRLKTKLMPVVAQISYNLSPITPAQTSNAQVPNQLNPVETFLVKWIQSSAFQGKFSKIDQNDVEKLLNGWCNWLTHKEIDSGPRMFQTHTFLATMCWKLLGSMFEAIPQLGSSLHSNHRLVVNQKNARGPI